MSTEVSWWEILSSGLVFVFLMGGFYAMQLKNNKDNKKQFEVVIDKLNGVDKIGTETRIEVKEIKATINAELPHITERINKIEDRVYNIERDNAKKTA